MGRNLIDRWCGSVTVSGTTDSKLVSVVDSSGDASYVTHEAHLQSGDSSAPMFIDDGSGALTMVGINWFIGNDGSDDLNDQRYLGNYDTEIQNYIDANVVPEMQHYGLFLSLALGIQVLRRRKQ